MRTESDMNESDARTRTTPRIAEGPSRPRGSSRPATPGAVRASRAALLVLLAATGVGCATSNHDFETLSRAGAERRAAQLSDVLDRKQALGEDKELYDVSVIPFARTRLNVFAASDDEDVPDGFVEADIDAYLPLFGFVDVTVRRYDTDRRMYESHEYDSYLWGLFQTYREQVDTEYGLRERQHRRLLWLFGWSSAPKYAGSTREDSSR